jgi:hypothetical protein
VPSLPTPGETVPTSANILGSAIESNGIDAIITNTSVGATNNWWGSPAGPEVATENPPSTSDPNRSDVLGDVDVDPFLTESFD